MKWKEELFKIKIGMGLRFSLLATCQQSYRCSSHFSQLLAHLAMEACLSDIKDVIIIPVDSRKPNAFWWPRNSMAELLPASFACR